MILFERRLHPRSVHMGISVGCPNVLMPQHFLDEPEVGSILQEMSRKTMSQSVRRDRLGDAGALRIGFDPRPNGNPVDWVAAA